MESWETNGYGEKVLLDTLKVPFTDENGNPLGIVGICHDVTNRYKTELDLKKAKEKAEESDRLKSSFLANMSHEIRTPMNAIIGFSDLLVDSGTDEDEREELVTHINNNCNTLLHLIDDIIDLAKIEANELTIFIKNTDINTILKELHEVFNETKKKIGKKHIDVELDDDKLKDNFYLKTDPYRFKQILINLNDNALKYTETGSVNIGYKILDDLNVVEFYVKDTGEGINPDNLEHVFERFIQIDGTTSDSMQGSGLGLSIVKAYVELLGGKVWVESKKDVGSAFHFTIPSNLVKEETHNREEKLKEIKDNMSNFAHKTILIAEDDKTSFEYLGIISSEIGISTILWAQNGEEAIEICKENSNIDLVLMDIKMPVMNGIEATRAIKRFNPQLPIISQTAHAIAGDQEKSLEAGCDDYITKPINEAELLEKYEK